MRIYKRHTVLMLVESCAATQTGMASISSKLTAFFNWPNPSSHIKALGSIQSLTEMSAKQSHHHLWANCLEDVLWPYESPQPATGIALPCTIINITWTEELNLYNSSWQKLQSRYLHLWVKIPPTTCYTLSSSNHILPTICCMCTSNLSIRPAYEAV
jgi:hypothetical protein